MPELDKNDRRFVKEWEYQTGGSKAGYFALNALIWTIMVSLFGTAAKYVASEFQARHFTRIMEIIYIILIGILIAVVVYLRNQCRYLSIKLKEAQKTGAE